MCNDPRPRGWFVFLLLTALVTGVPAAAIVNGQPPEEGDQRFDAVGSFSRAYWLGLDPEHKNAKDHNWYGNVTLIAPDVVLLAKHLIKHQNEPPIGEYGVRFRRNTEGGIGTKKDPAESYHNIKIVRFVTAPRADLAFGILEKPVEHIDPMPLDLDDEALDQAKIILAGRGSEHRFRGVGGPRNQLLLGESVALRPPGSPGIRFPAGEVEVRDWRENKETGEMDRKPYVTSDYPLVNLYDSGSAILQLDDEDQPRLIGVVTTYGGGMSLAAFDDDKSFPLSRVVKQGAAALEGLPYRAP